MLDRTGSFHHHYHVYSMAISTLFLSHPGYSRDVDAIAGISCEVTSDACDYAWEDYGLKLHIPAGSLPADHSRCWIEIRASLSGPYALPADCKLVSGVYTVHCPVELSNSIILTIQHCSIQEEGLRFVQADCTQGKPYSFKELGNGKFTECFAHVNMKLSQPLLIGVVKHEPPKMACVHLPARQYLAQVYLTSVGKQSWHVFFVITWDLSICIEVR